MKLAIQLLLRFAVMVLTAVLLRDVAMSLLYSCKVYGLSSGYRQLIFAVCLTAANWIDGKLIGPKSVFAKLSELLRG
jgi:hypothetical protein